MRGAGDVTNPASTRWGARRVVTVVVVGVALVVALIAGPALAGTAATTVPPRPSVPTGLTVAEAVNCKAGNFVWSSTPTLEATIPSNPAIPTAGIVFNVDRAAGPVRYNVKPVVNPTGIISRWSTDDASDTNNAASLPDGVYAATAYATNPLGQWPHSISQWTDWYRFTVETVGPTQPTITSPTALSFTLASSKNAVAFAYAMSSGGELIPNNSTCPPYTSTTNGWISALHGTATLSLTGLVSGPHTLYVEAFSASHVISRESSISFFVP